MVCLFKVGPRGLFVAIKVKVHSFLPVSGAGKAALPSVLVQAG